MTKYLRRKDVADRYGGVSVRTIERMVKDKRLPEPVYRGRFPLWSIEALDASDRAAVVASRPKRAIA